MARPNNLLMSSLCIKIWCQWWRKEIRNTFFPVNQWNVKFSKFEVFKTPKEHQYYGMHNTFKLSAPPWLMTWSRNCHEDPETATRQPRSTPFRENRPHVAFTWWLYVKVWPRHNSTFDMGVREQLFGGGGGIPLPYPSLASYA